MSLKRAAPVSKSAFATSSSCSGFRIRPPVKRKPLNARRLSSALSTLPWSFGLLAMVPDLHSQRRRSVPGTATKRDALSPTSCGPLRASFPIWMFLIRPIVSLTYPSLMIPQGHLRLPRGNIENHPWRPPVKPPLKQRNPSRKPSTTRKEYDLSGGLSITHYPRCAGLPPL